MGNKPISIGVETDQSEYVAGGTLRGKVYLSAREETSVFSLNLKLIGKESAVVHHTSSHTDSRGHTETESYYANSNRILFDMEYPLHTYKNQRLSSGQFEFPFSLALPHNLPSSFHIRRGESYAKVDYKVIAELRQPGKSSNTLIRSNPHAIKRIAISAIINTPVGADTSVQHPTDIIPVNCCCCSSRGTMMLETAVSKTVVTPCDSIEVRFRFRNNSSSEVSIVAVTMDQYIDWNCSGHTQRVKRTLTKQETYGQTYPELLPLLPKPPPFFGCFSLGKSRGGGYRHVNNPPYLQEQWHMTKLQVPHDSQDTYQGQAVTIRHEVTVLLRCKGCCMSNPDSTTSVHIVRRHLPLSSSPLTSSYEGKEQQSTNMSNLDQQLQPPTPSAPVEPLGNDLYTAAATYPSATTTLAEPSAPPSILDSHAPAFAEAQVVLPPNIAEAQVLPPNWNAQTAEVVEIPMAEAIVLKVCE
jgi:hypothetical protein